MSGIYINERINITGNNARVAALLTASADASPCGVDGYSEAGYYLHEIADHLAETAPDYEDDILREIIAGIMLGVEAGVFPNRLTVKVRREISAAIQAAFEGES